MLRSESIKELAAALSKAQGAFDHAKKDVKNEFFKSKYADLASVIDAAKKPLADNGLSVCQVCDTTESGDVILETILMHTSGEFISGRYPIRPVKTDPQAMGSAITYARRYAFSAITGIAADDDDGNGASQAGKPKNNAPEINKINYAEKLQSAISRRDLHMEWLAIPEAEQKKYTAVKDAMFKKLAPTTQTGEQQ